MDKQMGVGPEMERQKIGLEQLRWGKRERRIQGPSSGHCHAMEGKGRKVNCRKTTTKTR